MSLLAALATALLALAYVLAREMIAAPGAIRITAHEPEPILKAPRRRAAPIAPAATIAESPRSFAPPEPVMPASVTAPIPDPFMPVPMPAPAAAASSRAEQPELPLPVAASAANADTAAEPKERSFLPFRRANRDKDKNSESKRSESKPTMPERPVSPEAAAVTPTAAGFLERLRRGLSPAGNEAQATQASAESWLGRMRGVRPNEAATGVAKATPDALLEPGPLPTLRTNDLRHYLNQRLAASAAEAANDSGRKAKRETTKTEPEKVGPVLKSLDAVLNHILAKGGAPRALLVAGTSSKVDATTEAISIARALVARREQVLLVDLSRGAAAVSGPLGLPRSPGLSDLSASRASFEDVIRIDPESALQIITAGNPKLASGRDENESFGRVFDALLQAYDTVVLHADRETMRKLTPALKFELPLAVAVLPAGAAQSNTQPDIADFTALGCPVLIYEQNGKAPRSRLFGRVAAV
jgi:hypothetical protein